MAENALESVDKVLKLLMFFKEGHPIRVTDAGNRLGVARSTAHRLLSTLERRGFVIQDPTTRSYSSETRWSASQRPASATAHSRVPRGRCSTS